MDFSKISQALGGFIPQQYQPQVQQGIGQAQQALGQAQPQIQQAMGQGPLGMVMQRLQGLGGMGGGHGMWSNFIQRMHQRQGGMQAMGGPTGVMQTNPNAGFAATSNPTPGVMY